MRQLFRFFRRLDQEGFPFRPFRDALHFRMIFFTDEHNLTVLFHELFCDLLIAHDKRTRGIYQGQIFALDCIIAQRANSVRTNNHNFVGKFFNIRNRGDAGRRKPRHDLRIVNERAERRGLFAGARRVFGNLHGAFDAVAKAHGTGFVNFHFIFLFYFPLM